MKRAFLRIIAVMLSLITVFTVIMAGSIFASAKIIKPIRNEKTSNNTISTATPIIVRNDGYKTYNDIYIEESIESLSDIDYYKFELDCSGRMDISVESFLKTYSIEIVYGSEIRTHSIWYNDENSRAQAADSALIEKYTVHLEPKSNYSINGRGVYYIIMRGCAHTFGKAVATGNYNLSMKFTPSKAVNREPNNTVDEPAFIQNVKMTSWYYAQLAEDDGYDFFKFTLQTRGRLTLDVSVEFEYYSLVLYAAGPENPQTVVWKKDYSKWYIDTRNQNWISGYTKINEDTYIFDLENGVYYLEFNGKMNLNYASKYTGNYKFYTEFDEDKVDAALPSTITKTGPYYFSNIEKTPESSSNPNGNNNGGSGNNNNNNNYGGNTVVSGGGLIDDGYGTQSFVDDIINDIPGGTLVSNYDPAANAADINDPNNSDKKKSDSDSEDGGFPRWLLITIIALVLIILGTGAFLIIRQRSYDYGDGYDDYDDYDEFEDEEVDDFPEDVEPAVPPIPSVPIVKKAPTVTSPVTSAPPVSAPPVPSPFAPSAPVVPQKATVKPDDEE